MGFIWQQLGLLIQHFSIRKGEEIIKCESVHKIAMHKLLSRRKLYLHFTSILHRALDFNNVNILRTILFIKLMQWCIFDTEGFYRHLSLSTKSIIHFGLKNMFLLEYQSLSFLWEVVNCNFSSLKISSYYCWIAFYQISTSWHWLWRQRINHVKLNKVCQH